LKNVTHSHECPNAYDLLTMLRSAAESFP